MPVGSTGGGGASSGAIRAGGAFVELFAKDRLSPTLNKAQAKLASFGKFVNSIGNSALRTGSVLLAPVAALFAGTLAKSKEGVFGPQAQAHAQRFTDAWARAILGLQRGLLPVVELLAPMMETLGSMAARNGGVVALIAGVAVGLVGLGIALKVLGGVATLAAFGIGIVTGALGLLKAAALLFISGPVGALAVIAGGLAIAALSFADWGGLFRTLKATGIDAISGIIKSLKAGNFELAGKIAIAGLKLAWHDFMQWFKKQLFDLRETLTPAAKTAGISWGAASFGQALGNWFNGRGFTNQIKKPEFQADDAGRAALAAELAKLLAEAAKLDSGAVGAPLRSLAAESVKGLFQSPNFARALAFGEGAKQLDIAKEQLGEQKKANELLGDIAEGVGAGARAG